MSYFLDIREAFKDYSNGDIKEAYEMIGSILDDVKAEGVEYYEELLRDGCIVDNICPVCYGNLAVTVIGEDITEAWGKVEATPEYALICEECGGLIDDN